MKVSDISKVASEFVKSTLINIADSIGKMDFISYTFETVESRITFTGTTKDGRKIKITYEEQGGGE